MERAASYVREYRIYTLASTGTAQSISSLLDAAMAAADAPGQTHPEQLDIVQIALMPDVDLEIIDGITGDSFVLTGGLRRIIPAMNAYQTLSLKNNASVAMEVYYG